MIGRRRLSNYLDNEPEKINNLAGKPEYALVLKTRYARLETWRCETGDM